MVDGETDHQPEEEEKNHEMVDGETDHEMKNEVVEDGEMYDDGDDIKIEVDLDGDINNPSHAGK